MVLTTLTKTNTKLSRVNNSLDYAAWLAFDLFTNFDCNDILHTGMLRLVYIGRYLLLSMLDLVKVD